MWIILFSLRLEKESIVVCSSCVDNEGKVSLSQDVRSVGGRLVNSWTLDCTHLVMPTVKVTIKVRRPLITKTTWSDAQTSFDPWEEDYTIHWMHISLCCFFSLSFSLLWQTICALLCCRPIVKPEFFSAFSKAVQKKLPLPKPER